MRLSSVRRDGLSLLEVLVSLAIFLMALTALTYLVNTSSNLAAQGRLRGRAAQLARSKMNEFAAGAIPLQPQPDASFDEEPDYRWSADVGGGAAQGLFTVTVTVTYRPDDPYPTVVSMSRMILDPAVTGSTQDVPAQPDASGNDTGSDPNSSGGSSGSSSGGSGSASPSSGGSGSMSSGAKSSGMPSGGSGGSGAGKSSASAGSGSSGGNLGGSTGGSGMSSGGGTSGGGSGSGAGAAKSGSGSGAGAAKGK